MLLTCFHTMSFKTIRASLRELDTSWVNGHATYPYTYKIYTYINGMYVVEQQNRLDFVCIIMCS